MKTKIINILGSTGSIGTQALEICKETGIKVNGISANSNIALIEKQVREFKPEVCHIYNKELGKELEIKLKDTNTKVLYGKETFTEFATYADADTLLTSVVGSIGLAPTMAAIEKGMKIALANKETLVAAGELVMAAAKKHNAEIIPVDSEHGAIFQALQGNDRKKVKNIILTASGGPFFGKDREFLKNATRIDALKHPNWDMGAKITIDSATLMNKGFEVIEARWLFDTSNIKVVVHRESIIHSMVEYTDNSIIAQMGVPSMKLPIQYALTYPEREPCSVAPLDFSKISTLTFYEPDIKTFRCLDFAIRAMEEGGSMPLCLNSANEIAVSWFLKDRIKFLDIEKTVEKMLLSHKKTKIENLEHALMLDIELKEKTTRLLEEEFC